MKMFMTTVEALPANGASVEWIAPDGAYVQGTYAGDEWVPDGADRGVGYVPNLWRLVP